MKVQIEFNGNTFEELEKELQFVLNNLKQHRTTIHRKRELPNNASMEIHVSGDIHHYAAAIWNDEGDDIIEVLSYHPSYEEAELAAKKSTNPNADVWELDNSYWTILKETK